MKNEIIVNGYALDEEQTRCVTENAKYSIIIAGAGSGKTLTLIGKIKYLLENNIYKSNEICCISFTNEATNNLSKNIINNCKQKVDCFTFHKLALHILSIQNKEYKIASPNLLDIIIEEFFESRCYENKNLQKIIYNKFNIHLFKNDKKWKEILNKKEFKTFIKTLITFINLMKSNGMTKDNFNEFFKHKKYKNTLIIIFAIYTLYETEKESSNMIDFDDMMIYGQNALKDTNLTLPYKLIIIDEFQDTSLCRFNLINELVKRNDASLCVVGDDYQSIYHFSGCDLHLFLHFKDYYKEASVYKLERTYRNSGELIEASGNFIMKNKSQIPKKLTSPKHLEKPIILTFYKKQDSILKKVIERINPKKEILILGRNNFDLKKYTKNLSYTELENNYLEFSDFKNRKIRYLTIHTSKGLESDVVILLNVENSLYGIPSKLKDESILSLVKKEQPYPYEEERRLFYVALTRTKTHCYLLIPKNNPSIFVNELKKEKNITETFI